MRHVPEFSVQFWHGKIHDYCIVIPVINEGDRIHNLLTKMNQQAIEEVADIIIIDGGSTDGSVDLEGLQGKKVRALLQKTGPGKLSAQLRCAYAFALEQNYEGIVTIDGNDKDDPDAIPKFLDTLKAGYDFVQGSRFITGGVGENTPKIRELAIRWVHAPVLSFFSGFKWTDTTQGFRGYKTKIFLDNDIDAFREIFYSYELLAYLSYRLPRLNYKCIELPTKRSYPSSGKTPTKISWFRGHYDLLSILFKSSLGFYNPEKPVEGGL